MYLAASCFNKRWWWSLTFLFDQKNDILIIDFINYSYNINHRKIINVIDFKVVDQKALIFSYFTNFLLFLLLLIFLFLLTNILFVRLNNLFHIIGIFTLKDLTPTYTFSVRLFGRRFYTRLSYQLLLLIRCHCCFILKDSQIFIIINNWDGFC